jgi:hypothetical protein
VTKAQKLLLLASAASIILWAVPVARYLTIPLTYLNTHFHELAHALMAIATGGIADYIHVYADGSGVTPVAGGSIFLIASAGYPGTALLGAALILAGRTEKSAQTALKALSIVLGLSLLLFIRGDVVGVISAILWIPALWFLALKTKGDTLKVVTQFLGVQMSLTAFQALLILLNISATTDTHSDAQILQQTTFIPDIVWATLWTVFSLIAVGISLKTAWSPVRTSRER